MFADARSHQLRKIQMKKVLQTLLAVSVLFYGGIAAARDFYTGKTFRVTGVWSGEALRAERIQLRDVESDPKRGQIVAFISAVDVKARTLTVGPLTVAWDDKTQFKGMSPDKLTAGSPIRVSVAMTTNAKLLATSCQPAGSIAKDTVQITAAVTQASTQSGGIKVLTQLGVPVVVPQAGFNAVDSLTRRQDTRRPDQPYRIPVFGRPLTITGEYDATLRERRNFKLDDSDGQQKRTDLDHEFQVELFYPYSDRMFFFAEAKALYEAELRHTGSEPATDKSVERGQMWVFLDRLGGTGIGLQLGRQNLRETREWWWDTDLDMARMYFDHGPLHAELGLGQELARVSSLQGIDPAQKRVTRLMAMGSWLWASKQTIEVYALRSQDRSQTEKQGDRLSEADEDPSDGRLTWLGLRTMGDRSLDNYGDLRYWADMAWLRGRDSVLKFDSDNGVSTIDSRQDVKVRGTAFDLGVSWRTSLPWQPAFTLGYAQASGDDSLKDGVDSAFRQTGLHNNKWRFFGVNRFRYYGELLRPELSNLNIVTAAVGLPMLKNSSVELLYHRYRLTRAADSLRDVRIDADLTGKNRAVGQEVDLVFGFREWTHVDLAITLATFKSGSAYGSLAGKRAHLLLFNFVYNF